MFSVVFLRYWLPIIMSIQFGHLSPLSESFIHSFFTWSLAKFETHDRTFHSTQDLSLSHTKGDSTHGWNEECFSR